ncbi:MAG: 1-acyl-sn-glycerol-3-phosphate acyltransferase [Eggerthellaceae bacterium]|nr:1-acyl-sn-glycerol-3-phosphate acyltransferase [Eggerthellaceae bacterium]
MKLILSNKEVYDRPVHPNPGEKPIPRWFWCFALFIVKAILAVLWRSSTVNKEALRAFEGKYGVLLIGAHTSYLDPVFLVANAGPKQWPRAIGRDNIFAKLGGFTGFILGRCGAMPIKRDFADTVAVKRAVNLLKHKDAVAIFPEGTRRGKSDREATLHGGCILISRMANVPILPFAPIGVADIKRKGKFLKFNKCFIAYGDPVVLADFEFIEKENRMEAAAWYVMRESYALLFGCPASEVDMKQLFPASNDYRELFANHPIPKHTPEEAIAICMAKNA